MKHIGRMIKAQMELQPKAHTVTWLAEQLNCNRGNVYDIFKRATIDTELLMRISLVLKYDFFLDLSNDYRMSVDDVQ